MSLVAGSILGRYKLLHPVARGGMAVVWAARLNGERGFTKLVAVKTSLPELAVDPDFERMFLDEARLASRVEHPNVCQIFELGEQGGVLYIVMEWIHGDSLLNLLRGGDRSPLSPEMGARVVADACAGLHAAHELTDERGAPLQVVHRDMSPHNIMVTVRGHVKVTDFGIAKSNNQIHNTTSSGSIKGKVSYMAPEQLLGQPVDRRADVFALGCVLFEVTTGRRPFHASQEARVLYKILHGEHESASSLVAGYPQDLEAIVHRALAHDREKRFESAEALRSALESWLTTRAVRVEAKEVAAAMRTRLGAAIEERQSAVRSAEQTLDGALAASGTRVGLGPALRASARPASRSGSFSDGGSPPGSPLQQASAAVTAPDAPASMTEPMFVRAGEPQGASPSTGAGLPPNGGLPDAAGTITSSVAAIGVQRSRSGRAWRPMMAGIIAACVSMTGTVWLLAPRGGRAFGVVVGSTTVTQAGPGQASPAVAPASSSADPAGGALPGPGTSPASTPAPSATATAPPRPEGAGEVGDAIVLAEVPAGAVLVLDGVLLPSETRAVPRPTSGHTSRLVMRAGSTERAFVLDATSGSPFALAAPADAGAGAGRRTQGPPTSTTPAGPRSHDVTNLPSNPFERPAAGKDDTFRNPYQ
jgi:serine/threonine-protein kinase